MKLRNIHRQLKHMKRETLESLLTGTLGIIASNQQTYKEFEDRGIPSAASQASASTNFEKDIRFACQLYSQTSELGIRQTIEQYELEPPTDAKVL